MTVFLKKSKNHRFFEIFSRCGQNNDAVRDITPTKSIETPSMKVPEGDQTTAEGLGVGVLQTDRQSLENPEGDQTTAEGLGVGVSQTNKPSLEIPEGDKPKGDGRRPRCWYFVDRVSKYGDVQRGYIDGLLLQSLYINKTSMYVCVFVLKLLLGKLKDIDESYITGREILRGSTTSIFRIDPTTGSDAIVRKPDTGRKNGRKTAVF